jgi:Uma2 family endonuclease
VLAIVSPLPEHEKLNRTISLLVDLLAEEFDVDLKNLGSTTFKREDLKRGFEPDTCFYIRMRPDLKESSN